MRFFLPALLAVLIHLSFLGFKKTPATNRESAAPTKQVLLLPYDSESHDEQNLLAWMNILDASYIIQPNRKYGFSTTLHPVEVEDIPLILNNFINDNDQELANFLPVPWQDKQNRIRRIWSYTPASITPFNPADYKQKFECPAWLSENSRILPQLFENIDEIKSEIKKNPPTSQETVLKVSFIKKDIFPKVSIEHSCGSEKLDNAALRTFTVKSSDISVNRNDGRDYYYIIVKWYSK